MRAGAEFFTDPTLGAQRRYEAMRAYLVDEQTAAQVADRFGYSTASVHQMATLLRTGRMRFFADTKPGKPYVDALAAGEPLPAFARRELGFGSPEDAVGLVAFLASAAAADITGHAVGIGGNRLALRSHPAKVVVAFADGAGWSPDPITGLWPKQFAASQQTVGQQLPEPPK